MNETKNIERTCGEIKNDWAEIAAAIRSGVEFHMGDYKKETTLCGENMVLVVTDVTDEYVRFESRDCVGRMGISWSKEGNTKCGYGDSDVSKFLNREIWEKLPESLKTVISPTIRKHKDYNGEVKEYSTCLFLPAASEVFDEDEYYGDEGLYEQLEYYKDRRNRMKGLVTGEDTCYWWLASVRSDSSTCACSVDGYGYAGNYGASYVLHVPLCFTIKKKFMQNNKIPYERMVEIATLLKDGLIEDDMHEALLYLRDTVELTPDEAKFFEVDFSEV